MKKDSLLKMKDLPATEEMLAVAREDVPVKVGSGWNTSYRCRYSGFARSSVEGGILKVTLYDPDAMRLGGTLPVYEIFMEKEKQQFLTYDRAHDKWRTAKIDYLEWQAKGSNNVWISAVDDAQIRQYLVSDEKNVYRAILKFQRAVRDAELERRHRKETDPWDAELAQTPPLPKDWERWVNKVGIQENYIFYDYRKGGARYGYCTYCEKEVALKQRPYHNAVGKCPRCRHKITFKAKGKITDYLHSPTECAYLAQKCGDGFVVRQFQVSRQYRKEENTITSKTSSFEKQRIFYRADLSSHSYYWGWYKQRRTRWVEGIDEFVYENGLLMEAATRGDGDTGENITHNVLGISGIPDKIPYKERLVVTGEAFIRPSDFEALKDTLRDGNGEPYKNGRNLAAGSVRLLDCGACKDRHVTFMAFNVLEGFEEYPWKSQRLRAIEQLGFPICKYLASKQALTQFDMDAGIRHLRKYAQENDIPIDGIVVTYNDAAYAKSCGRTGHHYKDGLAFKFEDDTYETVLRSIEWTPSRTGEITPVAVFDTVEIDGCAVSRASLHNLSFIENLELMPGCRIKVSKRNQIIPHVEENLDRDCYAREKVVPARCPCCGQPTRIHTTRNTVNGVEKVTAALFCDNEHCETRKLRKFVHFASPKALNIMGLSESILEKFIGKGWLHSYMDIFALDKHRAEIVQMEGFGEKSWQNLWDAIQHSRITTFEQYLTAMDIPMVGSTASRAICQRFRGNLSEFETAVCMGFDFTQLPDFGETLHRNIHQWFRSEENWTVWTELRLLVCIKTYQSPAVGTDMSNPFVGKTLVVTGKVEPYTRDGINEKIESLGAHAGSSVSSKTDYLICGENAGSKLAKAQELGIKILSPGEFFRMAGESA